MRELIQNARDAIHARYAVDKDKDFIGKIKIILEKDKDDFWISIEDNGVGMSKRVLTGPFLDFGTSFWMTNLTQSEFPGLLSSNFRSSGKFGIGFYSVFMIADQVIVKTRKWQDGLSETHQLKFLKGLSLRPILSKEQASEFSSLISTKIKLKLKPDILNDGLSMKIRVGIMGYDDLNVPLKAYLSALCSALDTSVYYKEGNEEFEIHRDIRDITKSDYNKELWLQNVSLAQYQKDNHRILEYIRSNISRLQPIYNDDFLVGFAAINTLGDFPHFLSLKTVGYLPPSIQSRSQGDFMGFIDHEPNSVRRDIGSKKASIASINEWLKTQYDYLKKLNLNALEKYFVSSALSNFGFDPSEIMEIFVLYEEGRGFYTVDQLANLSLGRGIAFITSTMIKNHMDTYHHIDAIPNFFTVRPLSNGRLLSLNLKDGIPENNNSLLDCIYRAIIRNGFIPKITNIPNIGKNHFGEELNALILSSYK